MYLGVLERTVQFVTPVVVVELGVERETTDSVGVIDVHEVDIVDPVVDPWVDSYVTVVSLCSVSGLPRPSVPCKNGRTRTTSIICPLNTAALRVLVEKFNIDVEFIQAL